MALAEAQLTREDVARCPLCKARSFFEVYRQDALRYTMCEACTLVVQNPRPTAEAYRRFYQDHYQAHRHNVTTYERAVERLYEKGSYGVKERRAARLAPYLPKNPSVLDIGAGKGTLLKVLEEKYKAQVKGIEIGGLEARVATRHYGLPLYVGTFEEYLTENPNERFDLIVMVHVLEHLLDPRAALRAVHGLLKEGGTFYLAVPNIARIDMALERYFHFEHVTYFSPYTLVRLLEECGFQAVAFHERPTELEVFAKRRGDIEGGEQVVEAAALTSRYGKKRIVSGIKRKQRIYGVLRAVQALVRILMPRGMFAWMKRRALRACKALGIIES